jgi:glutamyl-tRNA reductase
MDRDESMSTLRIIALGINYRTTPVELREKLAFVEKELANAIAEVRQLPGCLEAVILSTCNRVELYVAHEHSSDEDAVQQLRQYLVQHFDLTAEQAQQLVTYQPVERETARHLFRVVSGLDSMVLGETEIFGQVKQAYQTALNGGQTGKLLNQLFQRAFSVGKLVREKTAIQRGSTSVGSVAVDLAAKLFDLKAARIMIIGAGEMARTCAQSLQSRGVKSVIVSNRNYERAVELASEMKGRALRFEEWEGFLQEVDIVISSTSAPHYVVTREVVQRVMKHRRGQPLLLIDIAVPRDIEPSIDALDDVYLYDIDQLSEIAAEHKRERVKELEACEEIIDTQLHKFGF